LNQGPFRKVLSKKNFPGRAFFWRAAAVTFSELLFKSAIKSTLYYLKEQYNALSGHYQYGKSAA
jgi:hypothetical protein